MNFFPHMVSVCLHWKIGIHGFSSVPVSNVSFLDLESKFEFSPCPVRVGNGSIGIKDRSALNRQQPIQCQDSILRLFSVELRKINGTNQTKTWLMPGADNLVKYYLSLATGPSEDLVHAIKEIAANNYESFEVTWRDVLNYKLDRISNYPENFTEKLEYLTRNEIAIIDYFLKNQPLKNFVESKVFSNSASEPLQ